MLSIRPIVQERIQKLDACATFRAFVLWNVLGSFVIFLDGLRPFFLLPVCARLIKDFNLVISGFQVVLAGLLDLEGYISVIFHVF
jgi:hypothetical protein